MSDEKKSGLWAGFAKKQKEALIGLIVILALGYLGYPITIRGVVEKMSDQTGGVPVLRAEFKEFVAEFHAYAEKVDKTLEVIVKDSIRLVLKLADRVVNNPAAASEGDMVHIIDTLWPAIPEGKKTASLTAQYQIIVDYYNQTISTGS